MWSFGRYCLNLSDRAFWRLTLGQLVALTRCYEAEREGLDYRTAIVASSILNTIPRTEKTKYKIFTPADVFPQYGWGKETDYESAPEITPEQILEHYRRLNAAMGGKYVEKVYGEENEG